MIVPTCNVCRKNPAAVYAYGNWICRECFMLLENKQKEMSNVLIQEVQKEIGSKENSGN